MTTELTNLKPEFGALPAKKHYFETTKSAVYHQIGEGELEAMTPYTEEIRAELKASQQ